MKKFLKSLVESARKRYLAACAAVAAAAMTNPVLAALPNVAPTNTQNIANGDLLGVARDYTDQGIDYAALGGGAILLIIAASGVGTALWMHNQGRGSMGAVVSSLVLGGLVSIVGIYLLTTANNIF